MATTAHMLMLLLLPSFSLVLGMQEDFISIDCGTEDSYADEKTGISYNPDSSYIHTGENHNISENVRKSATNRQLQDLRSFSEGKRNCYTLRPVSKGSRVILRAFFLHGNYDGQKDLPTFHLYVGTNLWSVVQVTNASQIYQYEIMVFATGDTISVCLLNVDNGRPFISALELRPTNMTVSLSDDHHTSSTVSIFTVARINFGAPDDSLIRYPDDTRDLIWVPFTLTAWSPLSTSSPIRNHHINAPEKVMQTAVFPTNGSSLDFNWQLNVRNDTSDYYLTFHMADLLQHDQTESRIVRVSVNGQNPFLYYTALNLTYLDHGLYWTDPAIQLQYFQCSIYKTKESTLPPIVNALEINAAYNWTAKTTSDGDVDAIMDIKAAFNIGKNWMGDPCTPPDLLWDGLNCSYDVDPFRIISLNLSSNGLTGEIPNSLFNLRELKYLDLSMNSLTGTIESLVSSFPNSKLYLNCSGLRGSSAYGFTQSCSSILQSDDERKDKGGKLKIAIPVIASVALAVAGGLLLWFLVIPKWRRSRSHGAPPRSHKKDYPMTQIPSSYCREFTALELSQMTNGYNESIGRGGFGEVYLGLLKDGTSVAVKRLSSLSPPGFKQFLAEINILKTVHHRNLVPFVGYCKDEDTLALVYQYMPQGSLSDHLSGKFGAGKILSWEKRLQLACEAAQGLEYLHVGCDQCIVHRDVKASNILLNEQMEAKIADFGLSKVFPRDGLLFTSTTIMGTPGYLDPEYSSTGMLTAKSDVYSFGIVLLELITGLPCIVQKMGRRSIVQHVEELLQTGNIGSIIDQKLFGAYELNSAWKAVEIAMECVATASVDRPTMSDVVVKLKDCSVSATHNSNQHFEDGQYRQGTPQHKQSLMHMPSAR